MSYTFSRRDFMKYTALTAVAVAGSSLLTGCSNPNRPEGKPGDKLTPGGKICEVTLCKNGDDTPLEYNAQTKTLTCSFIIKALTGNLEVTPNHFQVDVTIGGETKSHYVGNDGGNFALQEGTGTKSLENGKSCYPVLVVKNLDLTDAEKVVVKYWPRIDANGTPTDSYNDVYGSWNITDAISIPNSSANPV